LSSIKKLKKKTLDLSTVGCQPFFNWPQFRQENKLEKKEKINGGFKGFNNRTSEK
jgi:hypothetical protein